MLDLKIRDRREKGWFYLDNEYLNGYAKIFGPVGTSVYVSLCRHSDNATQTCFPSLETIARENGIGSTNTVRKYIRLFEGANIISAKRERDPHSKKYLNTVYTLLDKSEWVSHAQPVSMDSHAQIMPEPCATVEQSHAQPVSSKETHINKTHEKEESQSDSGITVTEKKYNPQEIESAWKSGDRRAFKILAWFFSQKGMWEKLDTKEKLDHARGRNIKAATRIEKAGWKNSELKYARDRMLENPKMESEWTLETLEKYLTK